MGVVNSRVNVKMSITSWFNSSKRPRREGSPSESEEDLDENVATTSTSAHRTSSPSGTTKKRYVKSWEKKFPWDPSRKSMLCRSCVKHKMNNAFTNLGCSNFRKTTLKRHTGSKDHIEAIQRDMAIESCVSLPTMMRELKKEAVVSAMRNIYWIVTEEIALLKYQSLNELLQIQGCAVMKELNVAKNAQYSSHQIAEKMLEVMSSCIEESTIVHFKLVPESWLMRAQTLLLNPTWLFMLKASLMERLGLTT